MVKKLLIFISIAAMAVPCVAAEKAASVTSAKGRVEIVHGDAVMGKRAKEGSELVVQDILRTKRRGYAEVGFVDGTNVKVFEKSRLTINGVERTTDGYNAEIQKGRVLFNVEKMEDVAGDFRVKTTNSVIGVKGTTFGIVTGGMVTIVEVYNGNVEVIKSVSLDDVAKGGLKAEDLKGVGKGGDAEANKGTLVANLSSGQGLVLSSSGDVKVYEFSAEGGGKSLIFEGAAAATKKVAAGSTGTGDGDDGDTGEGDDDGATGDDDGAAGDDDGAAAGDDGAAGAGDDGATGGDEGGSIDDQLFGSIGNEEEGAAGGDFGGDFKAGGDDGDDVGDLAGKLTEELGEGVGGDDAGDEGEGVGDQLGLDDTAGEAVEDLLDTINEVVQEASEFYSDPDVKPDTEEQVEQALGSVNITIDFK